MRPSAFSFSAKRAIRPRQVGRVAEALHVGLGEADVAVEQDVTEEMPIPDLE